MSTLKNYFLLTFIILLTFHQDNYAQVFIGVSGGASFIEQKNIEFWQQQYELKGTSFTRKLTIGYQSKLFGIEFGHLLLANIKDENDLFVLNTDKEGWEISGRGNYSFGGVSMFVKGGIVWLSSNNYYTLIYDQTINTYGHNVKSQDILWGMGCELMLNKWLGLRIEFESLSQKQFTKYLSLTVGTVVKLNHKKT